MFIAVAGRNRLCLEFLSPMGRDYGKKLIYRRVGTALVFWCGLLKRDRMRQANGVLTGGWTGSVSCHISRIESYQSLTEDPKAFI